MQRARHAAAERDLHGAEKGRRGVEETVGGREHDDARIRLRGLSESGTDEDRLVNRPFGNADLRLASDAQDRSPVGPQRHGRGVGLGAELPGASADGEFQRRDIAAVVLGLDADAAHLPFRRAYQPAFRHRRVETVGRALQLGQADRLVARIDLYRVTAHGIAATRYVVGEAVHAEFEAGDAVREGCDAPYPEGVPDIVAAVGDFGHEIAPAAYADGSVVRQGVTACGRADHGVALRDAAHGHALHGVDLDVVQAHDARRIFVPGADDSFADGVVEPLGLRVADFVMEVRAARRTAVARVSHHVALLHGPGSGTEPEVHAVRTAFVTLPAYVPLDVVAETPEVAVDDRRAVAEREVDGAPVAARLQYHARNVAVGRGHDRFALLGVGLDVHARMEMPGTDFAEIGRVEPLFELPQGVDVVVGVELLALCPEAGRRKQKKY